jgi:hypothetical protein
MCFALFLGARVAPPSIPCTGKYGDGHVYTKALTEYNSPVRAHFTLPHAVYVGSDQGCGCGFRNSSGFEGWPDDCIICDPDEDPAATQPNHESLVNLLRQYFRGEPFVELYGCWEGDFARPEKARLVVTPADITNQGFHFLQLGFCRVMLGGSP